MVEEDSTINITYETLFELLRREKNREELQKLTSTFYSDVLEYISEKKKVLLPESKDLFSDEEIEKTHKQIDNTRRIIKELFERREKKIMIMALNKARTTSTITDKSLFLESENTFFDNLVELFSKYRKDVLEKLINGSTQSLAPTLQPQIKDEEEEKTEEKQNEGTITIRFLAKVPKFLGKKLEVYGPFNADDMANLPADIANVLLKKGRAEEVIVE